VWVGLVPFRVVGLTLPQAASVPWLSRFAETNVRTYVIDETGRRGVWFFSLDAARLAVADGERVRVSSRRGSVEAPVRIDSSLRPGLAFMTLHFPDQVETNILTIDATDPKSGTAEFKASAIRVEKLTIPVAEQQTAAGANVAAR